MKITKLWALLGIPLMLQACSADETAEMAEEIEAESPAVDAGQSMTVDTLATAGGSAAGMTMTANLQPLNDSGTSGQATLTGAGDQTNVSISLTGLTPGAHPGHIHRGTCDALGPPAAPLPEITADASGAGSATGTAAISADTLMAGSFVVNYHGEGGAPIACGPIGH